MTQKKSLTYAQAKGAPAGFVLPQIVVAASLQRMVYTVGTSAAQDHYLNTLTGLVRLKAITNGVFVSFSAGANKAPARASLVLTSDNTEVTDGDTVTIGTTVYRFKNTPAQAYDVKRDGTTADTTLGNLVKAINGTGTPGTEYFAGTIAHPDVTASAVTAHATTVTAKQPGTAGNAIATAETSSHLSWAGGAATLASGATGNFDEYVPAGGSIDVSIDTAVSILSFIGDGGSATLAVIEY